MRLAKVPEAQAIAEDVFHEASRIGGKITDAVKDGVREANQQIRRGRRAAQDMLDEAKHSVKRRPFAAIGIVFAAGFLAGGLVSWAIMRRR